MGLLKKILIQTGFYNPVKTIYKLVTQSPSLLYKDIYYRIKGAPDGYSFPPYQFITLIIGQTSVYSYYEGGKEGIKKIISCLEKCSIDVKDFKKILDFGCGSGRLIRHLSFLKESELYGTDYNQDLIKWCQKKLPFAQFQVNRLEPPLDYESNTFDFIFLRSVFTHIDETLQKKWLKEFCRVLGNNGILLFTTHGDQFLNILSEKEKTEYNSGKLVVKNMEYKGSNLASSFQSPKFVENVLLENFELVSYFPAEKNAEQDLYILRKNSGTL